MRGFVCLQPSSCTTSPFSSTATSQWTLQQDDSAIMSQVTDGATDLRCHICSKVFNRMFSLGRHMRTHTGERPFPCYLCSYKASQKIVLQKHLLRIHHIDINGDRIEYTDSSNKLPSVISESCEQ